MIQFNEYDAVRLQNQVRDPKKMGIPAKIARTGDKMPKEKPMGLSKKRRSS